MKSSIRNLWRILLSIFNPVNNAQNVETPVNTDFYEKESGFKKMVNNHISIMLLIDPVTGIIIYANQAASKFYGYSIQILNSMSISEINNLTPEQTLLNLQNALIVEQNASIFKHKLASGELRDVEIHTSPIDFEGKKVLFSIIHDITERMRVEDALRNSELKFSTILQNSKDAIGVHVNGIWEMCNPASLRLFGYESEKELLGTPLLNVIAASERTKIGDFIRNSKENLDAPLAYTTIGLRSNGSKFEMEVTLSSFLLENIRHVYVILRDITERKKAEEELRQSETKYRLLFENMTSGFSLQEVITDDNNNPVDFRFIETNKNYNRFGEFNPEEVKDKTIKQVLPDADIEMIRKYCNVGITGEPLSTEYYSKTFNKFIKVNCYCPQKGFFATIYEDITEQKQSEQDLIESEERWKYALEGASNGVWDWNLETNKLYCSNQWKELLGITDSIISDNLNEWSKRVHPDDLQECLDALHLHIDGKSQSYSNVYRISSGGDTYKWVLDRGKIMVFGENHKPLRMIGTITDITDRIKMEEALRESQAKSSAILHTLPDMMFIQNFEGVYIDCYIPDSATKIISANEFLNKKIPDVFPPEIAAGFTRVLKNAINTKKQQFFEYAIEYPDRMHYFEARIICYDANKILSIIRDITDRKDAEEKLAQTRINLSLATRAGGVGVWDYNLINKVLLWDNQMFALYGISKNNFSGAYDAWMAELHPADKDRGDSEIQMAINGEKEFDTEFRVIWPDGSVHNIRALATVQRDENGKALHMVGTNWDITEQKISEATLIKAMQNADIANRAKSEFLANMSHEIRTPMNAILGFSEALYYKLESKQHQKMIKSVLSSGNLLLSLLNDILDLSKIEAGKLDITLQPVDIKYVLQEIMLLFKDKASSKNLEFTCFVEPDFPNGVMLDEIRIKQVLFNLVGNAIKFTKKGKVSLKLSFQNTNDHSGSMLIMVEDSGIGIPHSQYQLIFEAFRQQAGQSNREFGGTGLGLAISKRLVEKMHGSISVTSELGVGSIFNIKFPDITISNLAMRNQDNIEEYHNLFFEKSTLLIIDDIESNIQTIESLLSSSEIITLGAENGEVALELLKHASPDLILLDMRMPGIDGYEVARRIKNDPQKRHIPIIAFTASVMNSKLIESSPDFDGFLYKPVKRKELYAQLLRFLKYTIDDTAIKISPPDLLDRSNLPENLPEIITILNDSFMPKWESIKNTLALFLIEDFANELMTLAKSYNFHFLIAYANKIKDDIENIDLESIKQTVGEFPEIIIKLKLLV